jgi:hypothetical protein
MTVKRKVAGLVAAISAIGIIEKTSNDSSWWSSLSGVRIGRAAIAVTCHLVINFCLNI